MEALLVEEVLISAFNTIYSFTINFNIVYYLICINLKGYLKLCCNLLVIMKTIRLIFAFYSLFAFASLMITLSCMCILYTWGIATFIVLFWFKIISLFLIFYYTISYKKDVFYYYKNLGLTKKHLWVPTLIFDFILFLILVILTLKIK